MPRSLSHIYKRYQIYENNWTQLYNKISYKKKKKYKIALKSTQIKVKKQNQSNLPKGLNRRRSVSFKFTSL